METLSHLAFIIKYTGLLFTLYYIGCGDVVLMMRCLRSDTIFLLIEFVLM